MRPGVKKGTCNGVSSPVSSEMLAIRSPHSVLVPTAVTWRKNTGSKKKTISDFTVTEIEGKRIVRNLPA
jgi:hypothetical protein